MQTLKKYVETRKLFQQLQKTVCQHLRIPTRTHHEVVSFRKEILNTKWKLERENRKSWCDNDEINKFCLHFTWDLSWKMRNSSKTFHNRTEEITASEACKVDNVTWSGSIFYSELQSSDKEELLLPFSSSPWFKNRQPRVTNGRSEVWTS